MGEFFDRRRQIAVRERVQTQSQAWMREEPDLRDVMGNLWRRKWLMLGIVFVVMAVTTAIVFKLTPRYAAQAIVMIENRGTNISNLEAVVAGLSPDDATVRSEIEVIRSRGLAEKVVDSLGLDADLKVADSPRLDGLHLQFDRQATQIDIQRSEGWTARFRKPGELKPWEWLLTILGRGQSDEQYGEDYLLRARERVVDTLLSELSVGPKGTSRVIEVSYTSQDPKTAALVANAFTELYVREQVESKFDATRRASAWLNERVAAVREKVRASERAVEAFRRQSGLLQSQGVTLTSQQLGELNHQIILARTARAEAGARLRQTRNLLNSATGIEAAGEVLQSPLIQNLRGQEVGIQRKVAELSTELGDLHPRMMNLRAEAADLQSKIKLEISKIVGALENEVNIARTREASLQRSLEELKNQAADSNTEGVQLRALEREAEADRGLLQTLLDRYKSISSQEDIDIQQADARVISRASIPETPAFPNKKLILALALVCSSFIAVVVAFLTDFFDRGFRSGDQIERTTGVSMLGLVPMLAGFGKLGRRPDAYIMKHPLSALSESIRSIYASIRLSRLDKPPRKILITSSQPKEGKTTIAVSLAKMQAKAGQKVVILDADCRTPGVHLAFGVAREPGLVELLAGEARPEDVVKRDEASGTYIIPAGRVAPNAPEILASERMDTVLQWLDTTCDLVIVDSPPVMAVSDPRILSEKVDATVFVVKWADTRREVVGLALKQIINTGGRLAGVLLSMVNVRKHARYNFGDSGSYVGRLKRYYVG